MAHRHLILGRTQFSLQALFEYTTLCCVLAGLSSVTGIGASVCLMAFGLALATRQGGLALAAVIVASLIAQTPLDENNQTAFSPQFLTLLAAALLSFWYRRRAKSARRTA
jgi:uncharacterized membrane protein (UPF0136 family)